jgi:hypothetical protein
MGNPQRAVAAGVLLGWQDAAVYGRQDARRYRVT